MMVVNGSEHQVIVCDYSRLCVFLVITCKNSVTSHLCVCVFVRVCSLYPPNIVILNYSMTLLFKHLSEYSQPGTAYSGILGGPVRETILR